MIFLTLTTNNLALDTSSKFFCFSISQILVWFFRQKEYKTWYQIWNQSNRDKKYTYFSNPVTSTRPLYTRGRPPINHRWPARPLFIGALSLLFNRILYYYSSTCMPINCLWNSCSLILKRIKVLLKLKKYKVKHTRNL